MYILDAIGNESRRRILELLAKKPCYVSEISYYLRMAPKVVLEHLEKLESAKIVESVEDGRRRYYYIPRSIHLEITISPHLFEVNITSGRESDLERILRDIESKLSFLNMNRSSLPEIYKALRIAEEICSYFSLIHNSIILKLNELTEQMLEEVEKAVKDDLERLILLAITKGIKKATEIAEYFKIPYREVERVLESLREKGLVVKEKFGNEDVWMVEVRS
ncbi:MAG: ArsR family transcriptional regulator [Archaeoglobaceae archaeon]|nr:ArsR family transcriptional regulator [Archaeoglobaceae archaeon]MDW7989684.1 ArsR family transcriptional regulator [Archaeoglobaceae archaeon]